MEQNSTPLDPSFNIPSLDQSALPSIPTKRKFKFDTIYLIFSASIFVMSLGLMINSSLLSTTSDAKMIKLIPTTTTKKPPLASFPKSYKNEKIASTVYENLASVSDIPSTGKDDYIKTEVMKFYIYKDILEENSEASPAALIPKKFKDIEDGVKIMESVIKEHLLSQAFFGYVQVKFDGQADVESLKVKYGDLDMKAKNIMRRYQQMFVEDNYSSNQIIDISNKDEELLTLNDREKNQIIDNYNSTKKLFEDKGFDEFLFSLQQNQISDLYTLHTKDNKPEAYLIVYPTKILVKKYNSLDNIIEQRSANFSY